MRYGAPISHKVGKVEFVDSSHKNHSGARLFPRNIDRYIRKELKYKSVWVLLTVILSNVI